MALRVGHSRCISTSIALKLQFFSITPCHFSSIPQPPDDALSTGLPSLQPSYDADLISKILLQHHNPFHAMESSLQLNGIALSTHLVHQTLLRLRNVSKIALSFFLWAKDQAHHSHDVVSYNLIIDILAKVRQFDVAWQFIIEMDQNSLEPTSTTFRILIRRSVSAGLTRQAVRAFDDMSCFVEKDADSDDFCYLLDTLSKYGRASLHPDDRFERTIRDAEKVLDEMRQKGIEPDVTSYSIVIHVYSRAHKPELTLDKLRMMKDKGIWPTVATYTSVVKCLCSCGRLEDAEELVSDMVKDGVSPSAATYNCFFKEYRGRKDSDNALRLYRKMKEEYSCLPDMHTYNILVGMFVKLNRMEIVQEIWDDMKTSGAGPDLDSYTLLIHGLCEKQKWKEACHFFVEMIEKGYLPQKITFETLYRGLIQSDMLKTWRRLKKKLEEESITFGSEFQQYHFKPYRR